MPDTEYNDYLDALFLKTQKNDLLLELEWYSSDIHRSIAIIYENCEMANLDYRIFGEVLLEKLKKAYFQNKMNIGDFCSKIYMLWEKLPCEIKLVQPFHAMSYADDPLSWGDEKQAREICENMFAFYSKA